MNHHSGHHLPSFTYSILPSFTYPAYPLPSFPVESPGPTHEIHELFRAVLLGWLYLHQAYQQSALDSSVKTVLSSRGPQLGAKPQPKWKNKHQQTM